MGMQNLSIAMARFQKEVDALKGDALLDKKIDFDSLPPAAEGERDLRLMQGIYLEGALTRAFNVGGWQQPLADRRKARGFP